MLRTVRWADTEMYLLCICLWENEQKSQYWCQRLGCLRTLQINTGPPHPVGTYMTCKQEETSVIMKTVFKMFQTTDASKDNGISTAMFARTRETGRKTCLIIIDKNKLIIKIKTNHLQWDIISDIFSCQESGVPTNFRWTITSDSLVFL